MEDTHACEIARALVQGQSVRPVDAQGIERAEEPKLVVAAWRCRIAVAVDGLSVGIVANNEDRMPKLIEQEIDVAECEGE